MKTTLTTHTGFRFEVRRAHLSDEPIVAEFFTHVTPEDLRFRFLGTMKEISHERLVAMTRSDDPNIYNFLAFSTDDGLIAVAMLAGDTTGKRGEVAICIRQDRKHLGIGWELLRYLAGFGQEHGLETLQSIESRENHAAIELERDMGFTVSTDPDDPTLVLVERKLGTPLPM